ncbi:MAG: tyrosine-type recombinase/integrase [Lachnospiraceae bacterium]|nr:tyrosine-type recombinase/integrase [Lachnospiraceae bacterium]
MNNLTELYEKFINEKKSYCEEKTITYYEENLIKFIEYVADQELTRDIYINYIYELRKKNIKNTSIRTYCRAIKAFSNWLLENEYIEKDITFRVKLPREDKEIVVPLSEDEVIKLDNVILIPVFTDSVLYLRNALIIHLMLDAGLRKSEVINLNVNDIDVNKNVIYINNSKYNKSRVIPLSSVIKNLYNAYLIDREYSDIGLLNNTALLIKSDDKRITSDTIKSLFRRLKKQSGIERIHPHLLRHTFATSYLMQGGNLEQLRIILGHSDYNVTRHYLHLAASNKLLNYDYYKLDENIVH